MRPIGRALFAIWIVALAGVACSTARPPTATSKPGSVGPADRATVVREAVAMIGRPYRAGGDAPSGFDCSGLVVYSYRAAGVRDLPHSAAALEALSEPVPLARVLPGDLLFFSASGKKAHHVALYVGERTFVHAPSGGKRVERVGFDHVYWGPRLARAGRLPR